jgi:hypothetical protein
MSLFLVPVVFMHASHLISPYILSRPFALPPRSRSGSMSDIFVLCSQDSDQGKGQRVTALTVTSQAVQDPAAQVCLLLYMNQS